MDFKSWLTSGITHSEANLDGYVPNPVSPPTVGGISENVTAEGATIESQQWKQFLVMAREFGQKWLIELSRTTLDGVLRHLGAQLTVLLGVCLVLFVVYWLIYPKGLLVRFVYWLWCLVKRYRSVRAKPQPPRKVPVTLKYDKEGPVVVMDLPSGRYEGILTEERAAILLAQPRPADSESRSQDCFANEAEIREMMVSGAVQYYQGKNCVTPGVVTFRKAPDARVFGEGSRGKFGGAGTRLITAYHVWAEIVRSPSVWMEHCGRLYELTNTHLLKVSAYSDIFEVEELRHGRPTGIDVAIVRLPEEAWTVLGVKALSVDFSGVANKVGTVYGYDVRGLWASSVAKLRPTGLVDRYEHVAGTDYTWSGSPIIESRTGRILAVHTGRRVTLDGNYCSGLRAFYRLVPEESEVLSHDQWKRERELDQKDAAAAYEVQWNLDDGRELDAEDDYRWKTQVTYVAGKSFNTVDKSLWASRTKSGGTWWADEENETAKSALSRRKQAFRTLRSEVRETSKETAPAVEGSNRTEQDFRNGGGDSPTPLAKKVVTSPKRKLVVQPISEEEEILAAATDTTVNSPKPIESDPQLVERLNALERRLQKKEEKNNRLKEEAREMRERIAKLEENLTRKAPVNGVTTEGSSKTTQSSEDTSGTRTPSSSKRAASTSSEQEPLTSDSGAQGKNQRRRARRRENALRSNSENMAGPSEAEKPSGKASSTKPANSAPATPRTQVKESVSLEALQATILQVQSQLALLKPQSLTEKKEQPPKGKDKLPGSAT